MQITKLDAARRQLRTAIRLWFADDDPVSIYALTYAAHEVLHTLHRASEGKQGLVFDAPALRSDQERVTLGVKRWGNFFKHARTDPNKRITFNPEVTELLILPAADALRRITKQWGAEEAAFNYWFLAHNPDAMDRPLLPAMKALIEGDFNTKAKYWPMMMALWGTKIRLDDGEHQSVRYGEN